MHEYKCYLRACAKRIAEIQQESPVIILCGGPVSDLSISEAESVERFFRECLMKNDVEEPQIFLETESRNSPQNIAFAYQSLTDAHHHAKSVLILCDTFRAFKLRVIALYLMQGIHVSVKGIKRKGVHPHSNWWFQTAAALYYLVWPRGLKKHIRS